MSALDYSKTTRRVQVQRSIHKMGTPSPYATILLSHQSRTSVSQTPCHNVGHCSALHQPSFEATSRRSQRLTKSLHNSMLVLGNPGQLSTLLERSGGSCSTSSVTRPALKGTVLMAASATASMVMLRRSSPWRMLSVPGLRMLCQHMLRGCGL